jgi:hypothetical protein
MAKILLLILVAITLTAEAAHDSPKIKMAFDGVMAAAPPGKDS